MIISTLKKFLKFFLIDNSDKYVIEFIGNPGSGKTTIINNIYEIESNYILGSCKKNFFFTFANLLCFLLHKNIGLTLIIIKFILIGKYFLSEKNKISFKAKLIRLRKVFLILFSMLYKTYSSKNKVIFVESLLHQLISDNFDQDSFIDNILFVYGRPKIKFIFLNCSVNDSMMRMIKRGDNLYVNETTLKRYIQANNTHKYLYKIILNKYKNFKEIEKPLIVDSNNNSLENARNLLLNIKHEF